MPNDAYLENANRNDGNPMTNTGFQKKTVLLFLAAAALVLVVNAAVIAFFGSAALQQRVIGSLTAQVPAAVAKGLDTSVVVQAFRTLQYGLAVVAAGWLAALLVAMVFVVRKVARPIDKMGSAAESISRGRLDAAADIGAAGNGEIGKIAALISDMAMNLQEILLLVWNHTGQHRNSLQRLSESLVRQGTTPVSNDCLTAVDDLRRQIEDMRSTITAFDFYDVRLTDTGAVPAGSDDSPKVR